MSKEKIFYQMEAANGITVRVPADQLKSWVEAQTSIERAAAQRSKDGNITEHSKHQGKSNKK